MHFDDDDYESERAHNSECNLYAKEIRQLKKELDSAQEEILRLTLERKALDEAIIWRSKAGG